MQGHTNLTLGSNLPGALRRLIDAKARRDNTKFTASRLAKSIDVNRSLIQRLLTGEVENPRLDTLMKIARFFIADGFQLSLDDLIGLDHSYRNGQQLNSESADKQVAIPMYQADRFDGNPQGEAIVTLPDNTTGIIGIELTSDIDATFKAGSLLIVDTLREPEDRNFVAINIKRNTQVIIRRLSRSSAGHSRFDPCELDQSPTPNAELNTIGVITWIKAKTY